MFLRSGKVVVIVIRDSKSLLVRVRNRDSTIELYLRCPKRTSYNPRIILSPSSVGSIISLRRDEGGECTLSSGNTSELLPVVVRHYIGRLRESLLLFLPFSIRISH